MNFFNYLPVDPNPPLPLAVFVRLFTSLNFAFETGHNTPNQTVYLAQALKKDGLEKKARDLLMIFVNTPLLPEYLVEDAEQKELAKKLLAEWE